MVVRLTQVPVLALLSFQLPLLADSSSTLAFVQKKCVACHNATVTSGGVNLAGHKDSTTFTEYREIWERATAKMKSGEMPPPGVPKPAPEDLRAVTSWLESEFARQDAAIKPDTGLVAARRLNRAEYNNSLRDLLGIDLHAADNFPQDQAAFGFDNISDALTLSSVLLEKYADAAELSVRTALFGPAKQKPAVSHYAMAVRLNAARGKVPTLDLTNYDLTGLSSRHAGHTIHRFPVDAVYSFRLVLNGHRPNQSMPAHIGLWVDSKLVQQGEMDATDLEGQLLDFRMKVPAGEHLISASYLKEFHGLPANYNGPEPSTRKPGALINPRGKLSPQDIETLRKLGTKIKTDAIETRIDHRFEAIDIGGPFEQTSAPSPESRKLVFVCGKQTAVCAHRIISEFAARAFRRPLQRNEADRYAGLYALARKEGDSFDESIATALEGVLVSPHFLFRIERDVVPARGAETAGSVPVSDFELASRLSYFLWSSVPDAELLRLAGLHQLHIPAVQEAQVRRMLRDEKARALVDNFAGQWLQFRNIDVVRPDAGKFPDFDESLRYSMRRETELFLENVVRGDGRVLELLSADYSFLNERLARFYGVPGVTGPEFRRVDMSSSQRGGGVLAHGSILTISSYSTRTSPVVRGKWILENFLNAPPPPPPPSVPALDDSKVGESASLRTQMEAHRAQPQCASCHAKMDPLGFGLENLNAIGQWREKDGQIPVDSSGKLPDGRTFQGPKELKTLMLGDREAFFRALSEKMLIYALGRGLERYDRQALRQIEASLAQDDHFSTLALGIVRSLPFQMKHVPEAKVLTTVAGVKTQ